MNNYGHSLELLEKAEDSGNPLITYFIREENNPDGPIKILTTDQEKGEWWEELQEGNPHELMVIATLNGNIARLTMKTLRDQHLREFWYENSPEVMGVIHSQLATVGAKMEVMNFSTLQNCYEVSVLDISGSTTADVNIGIELANTVCAESMNYGQEVTLPIGFRIEYNAEEFERVEVFWKQTPSMRDFSILHTNLEQYLPIAAEKYSMHTTGIRHFVLSTKPEAPNRYIQIYPAMFPGAIEAGVGETHEHFHEGAVFGELAEA